MRRKTNAVALGAMVVSSRLGDFLPAVQAFYTGPDVARSWGTTTPMGAQQQQQQRRPPLFGVMDEVNSDAFDLLGSSGGGGGATKSKKRVMTEKDAYEIFLAELVFSTNDPRLDIIENSEKAFDQNFMDYLKQKVDDSKDVEEKVALDNLLEMIVDLKTKLELREAAAAREAQEAEEARLQQEQKMAAAAAAGASLSDADVLKKAASIDTADVFSKDDKDQSGDADASSAPTKKSFLEGGELSPEVRTTYEKLVKELLPPYRPGDTMESVVVKRYDECDAQLLVVLQERAQNGETESAEVLKQISVVQAQRMALATESLKEVLAAGDPTRMEGVIVRLAREQTIDEAFLLLLEANAAQAEAAGAVGPAALMRRLRERAVAEKDKQSSSLEIRLLRRLLRTNDPLKRAELFEEAFTPREKLLVPGTQANAMAAIDGELPDAEAEENKALPEVSPPDFINACKAVLLNFGNVESGDGNADMQQKIRELASEAEVVATRIYGKGMSPKEQQDRMWADCTTSIFDLETMEIEAQRRGEKAPWASADDDDEILPGFDKSGVMRVGGG